MSNIRPLFCFTLAFLALAAASHSEIINVPDDHETIQDGIDTAEDGDTVLVAPGVYEENIEFPGISITLASLHLITLNPAYIDSTIIDGGGDGVVLYYNDNQIRHLDGLLISLDGLTIQGGDWAGFFCHNENRTSITNCVFRDNIGSSGRGVVYLEHGENIIDNCLFYNNSGDNGGAIHCYIQVRNGYPNWGTTIRNTIIVDNSADIGGALYAYYSKVNLINCTIASNISEAEEGGGIFCRRGSDVQVLNSILWDNTPEAVAFDPEEDPNSFFTSYSDIEGGEEGIEVNDNGEIDWGEGNIDSDPLFADPDNGDYHLTEDSPCIDAGDPDSPEDPDETRADMGAYYFHQEEDEEIEWTEHVIDEDFRGAYDVDATDIDGDGDIDVFGAAYVGNEISLWENDGTQNFEKHILSDDYARANSCYAADLDSDGDIDILGSAFLDDKISWWENVGELDFEYHNILDDYDRPICVSAIDIDIDNDIDVLCSGADNNEIIWLENDGDQNFSGWLKIAMATDGLPGQRDE